MYKPNGIKLKIFIKEQKNGYPRTQTDKNINKFFNIAPLTGEKAKQFYEDLINEPSSACTEKKDLVIKSNTKTKVTRQAEQTQIKTFKDTDLLSLAQNNDIKNLESFFSQKQNYDVNVVDDFEWTPLMCACCSGAEYAVEILLQNGADPSKSDRLGNTALKLAKRKNYKRIVKMLEDFYKSKSESEEVEVEEPPEPFFCILCSESFKMHRSTHESSTLHLFNSRLKTSTFYGIPECNKGFQILLREGWDKERGLGPNGTGRKFPIKAIVKKDRKGIGAVSNESNMRQSHHTEKYESRRKRIYNKRKEKEFEKNFRLEFS